MQYDEVWDLVEVSDGFRTTSCKWLYKTKGIFKKNLNSLKQRWLLRFYLMRGTQFNENFASLL